MPKKLIGLFSIVIMLSIMLVSQPQQEVRSQDGGSGADEESCQDVIDEALQTMGTACAEVGRNEACYGHLQVAATFQEDVQPFVESGDIVDLLGLQALFTQPADPVNDIWGIALMTLQVDRPEESVGGLTYVLFGDTEISDTGVGVPVNCTATNNGTSNVNIRNGPGTNREIVGIFSRGATANILGRNSAGDWLLVDVDGTQGWVFTSLFDVSCDIDSLPIREGDAVLNQTPMTAITLDSRGSGACERAPDGLLVRSPEGRRTRIVVNGVELTFSSVAYLTGQGDSGNLSIQGMDGTIEVKVDDQIVTITPNTIVTVPILNFLPSGPPSQPVAFNPFDYPFWQTLQIIDAILIERSIPQSICYVNGSRDGETSNMRGGPGLNYFVRGTLEADSYFEIDGKAEGFDGYLWWRTTDQRWVREDIALILGDCATVPSVTPPPPPATSTPMPTNTPSVLAGRVTVEVLYPNGCYITGTGFIDQNTVVAGSTVTVVYGLGFADPLARSYGYSDPYGIFINGMQVSPVDRYDVDTTSCGDGCDNSIYTRYQWGAPPAGQYLVQALEQSMLRTCNLTIQ
jgi:uncharacterized protein YraI